MANFQVRYLVQNNTAGNPTLQPGRCQRVTNWAQVQAVEVCLVYGAEAMDLPAGSNYTDCDGTAVDMSTLSPARARRMHVPLSQRVFQLRSRGLIGTVL